jgi:hypothetical protein
MPRIVAHGEASALPVGTKVDVRDRFCLQWSHGFGIVAATRLGYIVERLSDRYVLPAEFAASDISRAL